MPPSFRALIAGAALACAGCLLPASAGAADSPRPGQPVVLSGAKLANLQNVAPERVVALSYERTRNGLGKWRSVPVQVDERVLTDFGQVPGNNGTAGTTGTVYGGAPIGQAVLQYADPETFVGPDSDPALDADDEVAMMASDAGERAPKRVSPPRGLSRDVRVSIDDPLGGTDRFLYLFARRGSKRGLASTRDYVDYDFALASGDYRATYLRADGPNPESSRIRTRAYEAGFSDRWLFDHLRIKQGGADSAEILDGFKFSFGPESCGRSEATFSDAEGAFVANIDGPVRAIRAYVGANSGPLTERTHYFYDERHEIVTDLRVHAVPGPLIYHDLSAAGIGMEFINSANPAGAAVDGEADSVAATAATWRMWSGEQGALFAADRLQSSFADSLTAAASEYYLDDSTPPYPQCWGDSTALGQAGFHSTAAMPNTDPRQANADSLKTTTTEILAAPGSGTAEAKRWSQALDEPLGIRVR